MSPRSGGEAAKFGERYEGRWTTRHLLYVLLGDVDSVAVEDVGEISLGSEFTVRRGQKVEIHHVKRQKGDANEWELRVLQANGVLAAPGRCHLAGAGDQERERHHPPAGGALRREGADGAGYRV